MPEISLPFCKRKLVGSCLEAEYQRAARRSEKQIPQPVDGNAYNPMPANMGLRLTWVERDGHRVRAPERHGFSLNFIESRLGEALILAFELAAVTGKICLELRHRPEDAYRRPTHRANEVATVERCASLSVW